MRYLINAYYDVKYSQRKSSQTVWMIIENNDHLSQPYLAKADATRAKRSLSLTEMMHNVRTHLQKQDFLSLLISCSVCFQIISFVLTVCSDV